MTETFFTLGKGVGLPAFFFTIAPLGGAFFSAACGKPDLPTMPEFLGCTPGRAGVLFAAADRGSGMDTASAASARSAVAGTKTSNPVRTNRNKLFMIMTTSTSIARRFT